MKALIVFMSVFLSLSVQAAKLKCPKNAQVVLTCTEATQKGDFDVAIKAMDGAVVCQDAQGLSLIMSLPGKKDPSPAIHVTEIVGMGSTDYSFREDEVKFTLSKSVIPGKVNGRFSFQLGGQAIHRSLSCK